jgi:hypothetical protein
LRERRYAPLGATTALDTRVTALEAGSGISNVVEDLTPELGGNLDALSFDFNNVDAINFDVHSAVVKGNDTANEYSPVVVTGSKGGYGGISLDGNFNLMNSGGSHVGLYDDVNNEWFWLCYPNAYVSLYGNGTEALRTLDGGGVQTMNGGLALSNTNSTSKYGIGLYGSVDTDPTYGIMFTIDSEDYGGVTGGWATVFTMDNTAGRGWKFNNQGYGFAVASVENTGEFFGKSASYMPNQSASINYSADQVHYAPCVPGGTFNSNASTQTGYMRINLPTEASGGMMSFTVRGYDYSTKGAWAVNISGYEYIDSNAWVNESINVLYGRPPFDIVYMGKATGSAGRWILFGNASLSWNYPQIAITDFYCGYSGQDNHLVSGDWTIDFSASVPTGWSSEYSLIIGGNVRWEGESGFQNGGKMSIQSGGSASGGQNGDIIFIY